MMSPEISTQPTKLCPGCLLELPRTAFWRLSSAKTGCQSRCKACLAEAKVLSRTKHLEESRARERAAANANYAADPEKFRAKSRNFVRRNPDKARTSRYNSRAAKLEKYQALEYAAQRRYLLRQYGISQEDFDALWAGQNGACPICQLPLRAGRATHIDHHHETGAVRGLLCSKCNQAIGLLRESTDTLERAIAYLRPLARW